MSPDVQWYYALQGRQHGPVSADALRERLGQGNLHPDDLVWCEGMAQWQPVGQVAAIAIPGAAPLAPPQKLPPPIASPALAYDARADSGPYGAMPIPYYPSGQSYNTLATIGFVFALLCPLVGLILSLVALNGMKNSGNHEGDGLAKAGVIIPLVIFGVILLGACLWFTLSPPCSACLGAGKELEIRRTLPSSPLYSGETGENAVFATPPWRVGRSLMPGKNRPTALMFETLESRMFLSASVTAPPAPVTQPPAYALLGGNLNAETDRVEDLAFTDLVKTTRGFYNAAGRLASNGAVDFAATDANGWPTEDFSFTAVDHSETGASVQAGVYPLSFVGPSTTVVSIGRNSVNPNALVPASAPLPTIVRVGYNAASGVNTYNVTVPQGALLLGFNFTKTQGKVHDIKLLQPGYSLSSYPIFSNAYLNLMRTMSPGVIRLMDFTHTNGNLVANWADRTQVTDATQARASSPGATQSLKGVAWEYGIQLANALHANIWVNIPAHATDAYVRQLAQLLLNTLNPSLAIYVEYSNEVWNGSNEQYTYNKAMATSEVLDAAKNHWTSNLNYDHLAVDLTQPDGGANATLWADRRYARRSKVISDLFKSTWTDRNLASPINTRVRVILSGQIANPSRFDNELKFISAAYGAPKQFFYAIGVAPYLDLGKDDSRDGLTDDQVIADLSANSASYKTNGAFSGASTRAKTYGLKLVAYEGGMDLYGATSIAGKAAANHDPRLEGILTGFIDTWYSQGGDLFNWYTLGARSFNSPFGSYSITDDINNYQEPKELAYITERDRHT